MTENAKENIRLWAIVKCQRLYAVENLVMDVKEKFGLERKKVRERKNV